MDNWARLGVGSDMLYFDLAICTLVLVGESQTHGLWLCWEELRKIYFDTG